MEKKNTMKLIILTTKRFGRIDHKALNEEAKIFATRDGVIPDKRLQALVELGATIITVKS